MTTQGKGQLKKSDDKILITLDDEKSLGTFLQAPSVKIAEFLTGFLSSDKNEWKQSTGHLVQAVIKNTLFTQLGIEIEKYIKNGKIKEDYFATNKNKATLLELLKFIDEEAFDEEKFEAMKSIFFYSVEKNAKQQDEEYYN